MTNKTPNMEAHLTMIRAFASVISPNNWRDIKLQIVRQFEEIERVTLAETRDDK